LDTGAQLILQNPVIRRSWAWVFVPLAMVFLRTHRRGREWSYLTAAGWWLALGHLLFALGHAITIIGLPFAWADLKLAGLALWPIGKMIVPIEEARRGRYRRYGL
jgi:hypothetical protein